MIETDQSSSEKAINRALVNVSLKWGVDPELARHNPVFWHEGSLNYHDPVSHREAVFGYLKSRGILGDGLNGAFKLNYGLDELDQAANADFDKGVDIDVVIGLLVSQLFYQYGELGEPDSLIKPSLRTVEILEHLKRLGYLERSESDDEHGFRWADRAEPMLKAHYLL
jgi:hypothetical protein